MLVNNLKARRNCNFKYNTVLFGNNSSGVMNGLKRIPGNCRHYEKETVYVCSK